MNNLRKTAVKLLRKYLPQIYLPIIELRYHWQSRRDIRQLKKILNEKVLSGGAAKPKTIVFNLVRGVNYFSLHFHSVIGKALALRGHKVYVLVDDRVLKHCDSVFYDQNQEELCRHCDEARTLLFGSGAEYDNLKFIKYSELIDRDELARIEKEAAENDSLVERDGVNVEQYVNTSVIRYFRSGRLDGIETGSYKKQSLQNCLISLAIAKKIKNTIDPDVFFTDPPIYATWGPIYDYFQNNGAYCVSYGGGAFKVGNIYFNQGNEVFALSSNDAYWASVKNKSLAQSDRARLIDYMDSRFKGKSYELELMRSFKEGSHSDNRQKLDLSKPTFGIFPNMAWESALVNQSMIFNDLFEWLQETIVYFKSHPEKNLIIKLHPAELCFSVKSQRTVGEFLLEKFPSIHQWPNVSILGSYTESRASDLFPLLTAGIVFNGTLGLEMAYQKIPVLAAGKAHYARKGFIYDINDRAEYFKLLDDPEPLRSYQAAGYEDLLKYLFVHFIQKEVPLRSLIKGFYRVDLSDKVRKIIKPGANKLIGFLCDCLTDRTKYFQDWYYEANTK